MSRIRILSEEVANRIAAGEVIERPASVVKELVENSIDSGATSITVNVQNGGKSFIQVIDNGIGMSEDDALTSFERHATSKIRTVTDIFSISSLGFRGEALPSIASISKMSLITKNTESVMATEILFESGKLKNVTKTSANKGTTITIEKLFWNIPARKKFLKSDQVEYKHILKYIHYQAIIYPKIHFRLISNGKIKLNYPIVEEQDQRLLAIFGSEFLKNDMIEISASDAVISVKGYIKGLEETPEGFNDFRYLFVNGRFIFDKIVTHSIKAAYEPFIRKSRIYSQGKIPPYILFIKMNPNLIDFNVHPTKKEIRFRDSQLVHNFIKSTLSRNLLDYEENKYLKVKTKFHDNSMPQQITNNEARIFTEREYQQPQTPKFSSYKKEFSETFQPDLFSTKKKTQLIKEESPENKPSSLRNTISLKSEEDLINPWQLHQSYIFTQVEDGLLVIDQHAAHERILYEKILHRIHGVPAPTQKLLFPIVVDIPPIISETISDLISENIETIQKIGFSIKTFSGSSIVIDEIPAELEDWDGGEVFIEILKQLETEFQETEDFRDSISKSVSCKAAIKAGTKLGKKEMLALINDLFACEVPYFCPHGRPLVFKMTLNEFEKKFKRIM